uniref:CSON000503 protein n=1 Tax=Culicoides sonorensis TaxID=179676 RepID=A0A336MJ01_CULSO
MTTEPQPKRIKLEILKGNGSQNNKKIVKLMPFGSQHSKDLNDLDESSGSSRDGFITPTLTLRNISIHQQQQQQQQQHSNNLTFNAFNKGVNEDFCGKKLNSDCNASAKSDVIALSDDTDSEATEKDLDPQRNFDFIEEASVMDDEIMDDFPELFQHPMNDEHHEKIFDDLLNATSIQNEIPHKDLLQAQSTNFNHHEKPTINENEVVNLNNVNNNTESTSSHHDFLINPSSFVPIASKVPDSTHKTESLASEGRTSCTQTDMTDPHIITTGIDILNYLKRIDRRLGNIEKRLTKIEEVQNSQNAKASDSSDADDLIDDDMLLSLKFPIKKKHSLEIFENIIKVPKMKRSLELKFKQYLGINESDTIDMILAEMIDPVVQNTFKWRQSDTTRSFENYVYINKLIFDCVKHHFQHFTNVEYIRLMSLILNRPARASTGQKNLGNGTTTKSNGSGTVSSE